MSHMVLLTQGMMTHIFVSGNNNMKFNGTELNCPKLPARKLKSKQRTNILAKKCGIKTIGKILPMFYLLRVLRLIKVKFYKV
jgi:hypothetical protein